MSVQYIPNYTPLLYSKTGICRGIPIFLILLQNIYCGCSLEPPRREKYHNFSVENFHFLKLKNSLYIAWASLRNGMAAPI